MEGGWLEEIASVGSSAAEKAVAVCMVLWKPLKAKFHTGTCP